MPGTVLLLFARSGNAESRFKKVAQKRYANQRFFDCLNVHAQQVAIGSGLPVIRCDDRAQDGGHFGERLSNAIADAFARGFEQVIVIGNDCPALRSRHVQDAARRLHELPVVIGPDYRGGAYLIGIQKAAFQQEKFAALCWQTSALANDLRDYARGAGQLGYLHDINEGRDFFAAISSQDVERAFRGVLISLFGHSAMSSAPDSTICYKNAQPAFLLRGPPVAA